jgi:hypothetical protein
MTGLSEKIVYFVDANSGGIKFTELLTKLMVDHWEDNGDFAKLPEMDAILEEIEQTPCLGTLNYVMKLGGGMGREKLFVYRNEI